MIINRLTIFVLLIIISVACNDAAETNQINIQTYSEFAEENFEQMAEAIDNKDTRELIDLLKGEININSIGDKGFTLLHWSIRRDNFDAFKLLLEHGADPNIADFKGKPPLVDAAISENPMYLIEALKFGGDANYYYQISERNIIFEALLPGHLGHIIALIEAGADINVQDKSGDSPIMLAAYINQYDLVYYLLERGADYKLANVWNKTIIDVIQESYVNPNSKLHKSRLDVIKFLESQGEVVTVAN